MPRAPLTRLFKEVRRSLRYYLLALPLVVIVSRLPLRVARAIGWIVGTFASVMARTSRARALENLELAFGQEKSAKEIRRIVRGVLRMTAINMFELLVVQRWSKDKVRRYFNLEAEFQHLNVASQRGAVGLTAHFGNWELLGLLGATYMPGRVVAVAKRIYFEKYQELVDRFRRQAGLETIYTDAPPRRMIEALQQGHLLAMLPDQNLKAVSGVFVDFFGRPAYTSTAPAHLALAAPADLITVYMVREGGRYRVLITTIPVERGLSREENTLENTRRWTNVLETTIRQYPDQWVWFHRRWRTRPEDGPRKVGRRRKSPFRNAPPSSSSPAEAPKAAAPLPGSPPGPGSE